MLTDSKDYPFSDALERKLVQQAPRNRQIPHQRNCGHSNTKRSRVGLLGFIQKLLKNVFQIKPAGNSRAS